MPDFKFDLGDIVRLDPTGDGYGAFKGRVLGRTEYVDGSIGYVVSVAGLREGLSRHYVAEAEISLDTPKE